MSADGRHGAEHSATPPLLPPGPDTGGGNINTATPWNVCQCCRPLVDSPAGADQKFQNDLVANSLLNFHRKLITSNFAPILRGRAEFESPNDH